MVKRLYSKQNSEGNEVVGPAGFLAAELFVEKYVSK